MADNEIRNAAKVGLIEHCVVALLLEVGIGN